jgi:hypothetical protein
MSFCKLSDQTKNLYLEALHKLRHPESFSVADLLEVMFELPTKRLGCRRKYFPTRGELSNQIHSLPGIKTIGIKQTHGQQFRLYRYDGGLQHDQ